MFRVDVNACKLYKVFADGTEFVLVATSGGEPNTYWVAYGEGRQKRGKARYGVRREAFIAGVKYNCPAALKLID